MKKRKLFAFALASLMMVGCSNDSVIDEGGGTDQGNQEAWFALNLKTVKGGFTRTLNNPAKNPAEAGEIEIPTAKAIFFKYTGNLSPVPLAQTEPNDFVVVDVIDLTTAQIGTPGQGSSGTRGNAFKVNKGIEYLLFIGNPPVNFPTIVKEVSTFADVNKAIKASVADVASTGKFMMTNAKGDLEPSVDQASSPYDPTLEPIITYADATNAEAAPTSITIDRVVAKVRVYTAANLEAASKMKFQNLGWLLNVTNNYFFPVSERVKTNLESASGFSSWVWSDAYHIGSYRKDPNYSNNNTIWNPSTSSTPTTEYTDHYTYFHSGSTVPSTWNKLGVVGGNASDIQYCLENTQDAAGNMQAYTTQILLKGIVNPVSYQKPDNSSDAASAIAHDWLAISDAYYTPATLNLWIKATLEGGNTALATAFNVYLTEIAKDGTSGVSPVTIDMTSPATIATTIGSFETQIDKVGGYSKRAGTYGTVKYYDDGTNYYRIMIKHDNDNDKANNELGEFGVVRNSVYDVNVTAINSPGYPVIPDPEPETPDEIEEAWLSIVININDWTWYTQNEEL